MFRQCSVEGCSSEHYGHGYCVAHYKRWRKYGDPAAGGIRRGEVKSWLINVALPFRGDDCLKFPFCTISGGYGRVNIDGEVQGAHVVVLTAAKGPKPTPKHECCHKCGRGHEGCVNPLHLYWGTRKENVADAKRMGRLKGGRPKGYAHPGFKMTPEKTSVLHQMIAARIQQKDIAKTLGISPSHVSQLKRRRMTLTPEMVQS